MKQTFYEKVGKRYRAVSEYDPVLAMAIRTGTHLIVSHDSGETRYYDIKPAWAPMFAAGCIFSEAVIHAISDKLKYVPCVRLTERQQKAWDAFEREMGEDGSRLTSPSLHDCVEAGTSVLFSKVLPLLENPSVKAAYDQFVLLCELTKDEKHD